jgi:PAS domain S-box-containing protein
MISATGIFYNVDARVKLQEKIKAAHKEWGLTFDNVPDLISIIGPDLRIRRLNRALASKLGRPPHEIIGRHCHEIFHDQSSPPDYCPLAKNRKITVPVEYIMKDSILEGSFHVIMSPLHDSKGDFVGCVNVARDVSSQIESHEKLRSAHQEITQLVDSIPTILINIGSSNLIKRWNKSAERLFGLSEEQVVQRQLEDLDLKWEWAKIDPLISQCRDTLRMTRSEDISFQYGSNGKQGFLQATFNPIPSPGEGPPGVLMLATDVTEKKALESQLMNAQKLESIGQLAAGIAHEINTPTQYVGDNAQFLQEAFSDLMALFGQFDAYFEASKAGSDTSSMVPTLEETREEADFEYLAEEIPSAIDQTLEGVHRISEIVRSMKEFSHPGTDQKTSVDLNCALGTTLTVARNEWKYVAELETDFDPNLPSVACYPGEINQVFLNIIVNAAHAIAGGAQGESDDTKGSIRVATRSLENAVEIRISDTGAGIPAEIQHRIFDPFFTTKEVGKGTGQGLAIAHSVVTEKHNGSLTFETRVGQGTTFILTLPLA